MRESEIKTDLYPPLSRPMSSFRFLCPPIPVDSILEARRALPRTPRGPQAGFLNFVTFKFKHSHLLRSPPPQCLCLLPMPILSLPSHGAVLSLVLSLSFSLAPFSLILSLVYYVASFVSLSVCARSIPREFFPRTAAKARTPRPRYDERFTKPDRLINKIKDACRILACPLVSKMIKKMSG